MGLDIVLGGLAKLRGPDHEWAQFVQNQLDIANELLERHGYPPYREAMAPEVLDNRCPDNHFRYSIIHFLRRAYARKLLYPDKPFEPLPKGASVADDEALQIVTERGVSHLVCHSDCSGMYIPADFRPVLADPKLEGEVGSSYRLMEELQFVAPAIGIRLNEGKLPDDEVERLRNLYLKPDADNIFFWKEIGATVHWVPGECSIWFSLYEAARLSIQHGIFVWFC
jgi:hypothetical protein